MRKTGYLPEEFETTSEKVMAAEGSFLRAVGNCPNHVLRTIFPQIAERTYMYMYDRRPRPHDYQLPERDDRNFINRVLFPSAQVRIMTLDVYLSIGTISLKLTF